MVFESFEKGARLWSIQAVVDRRDIECCDPQYESLRGRNHNAEGIRLVVVSDENRIAVFNDVGISDRLSIPLV